MKISEKNLSLSENVGNGASAKQPAPGLADRLAHRLAAQWRAPRQAARGAAWEHDSLPRLRDEQGNPRQSDIVYLSPPLGCDKPVADTTKAGYLRRIADAEPAWADWLQDFHDQHVLAALNRHTDKVREAWEKLRGVNAEIERYNAALEARQAQLEALRDAQTQADRDAIRGLDQGLNAAFRSAGEKIAAAGGTYDPDNLGASAVLAHEPLPIEVVAGGQGLPLTPGDADRRLHKALLWAVTVGVGFVTGLSLALITTLVDTDNMFKEKWGVTTGFLFIGAMVAIGCCWAIKYCWGASAERYYLARFSNHGVAYWVPSAALGVVVSVLVVGMDACVEYGGLMKIANLEHATQAGEQSLVPAMAYLVGLVITFGYAVTCAREGALDGRYHPCRNRLMALQAADFADRDNEIRARPEVREALHAIAIVHDVKREKAALEARVEAHSKPFDDQRAHLEGLKKMPEAELPLADRQGIQDAYHDWIGANSQYEGHVRATLAAVCPIKGMEQPVARRGATSPAAPRREGFLDRLRRRLGWSRHSAPDNLQGTLR